MITIGDNIEIAWRAGITVGEILDRVPDGRDCAAVRVNGRIVARPRFAFTTVPDGASIDLVPMIAGG
jgi:sulfur carrier protein ThiS